MQTSFLPYSQRRPTAAERRVLFAIVLLSLLGCSDRMSPPDEQARFEDLLSSAALASKQPTTVQALMDLEHHLVEELGSLNPSARAELRQILDDPYVSIAVTKNPRDETERRNAALATALLDLRSNRWRMSNANPVTPETGASHVNEPGTRVQIVLVAQLRDVTAQAMIFRSPGDRGRPTLVLPEATFSAIDIERGVRIAAQNVKQKGETVQEEQWISIHRPRAASTNSRPKESSVAIANELLRMQYVYVPGIGRAKAFEAMVKSPQVEAQKPVRARP